MAETVGSVTEWNMPYTKAKCILYDKYKATQEEIVLWIETKKIIPKDAWCLINLGGNEKEVLRWNLSDMEPDDLIKTLGRIYFNENEIKNFVPEPEDRWVSFKQIVERWKKYEKNSFDAAEILHTYIGVIPCEKERYGNKNLNMYQYPLKDIQEIEADLFSMAQAEAVGDDGAVSQADTGQASTRIIKANGNEFAFSGLLNIPSKKDGWFSVIDDMTRAFYRSYGTMPNEFQAWAHLYGSPPNNYKIETGTDKGGEDCLKMPGAKPLSKSAFSKRWASYTEARVNRQ